MGSFLVVGTPGRDRLSRPSSAEGEGGGGGGREQTSWRSRCQEVSRLRVLHLLCAEQGFLNDACPLGLEG